MSHGNARTTFHGRLLIVQRYQQGWRQAHIAAAMGISRRCVGKWIGRFASEGVPVDFMRVERPGMEDVFVHLVSERGHSA